MPVQEKKDTESCTTALVNSNRILHLEKKVEMLEHNDGKLHDMLVSLKDAQQETVVELRKIGVLLERFTPTMERSERGYHTLDTGYKAVIWATGTIVFYQLIKPYLGALL